MHPTTSVRAARLPYLMGIALVSAAPGWAADLTVVAVEPAPNAVGVSTAGPIAVEFSDDVDPATVEEHFYVFGRWSGPVPGVFQTAADRVDFIPDRPFFPGEMVTVQLARSLQSTGGGPLRGGYTWSFYAGSRAGSGNFTLADVLDVRFDGEGLIQSYGIYAGDIDGDGAPDFSIPNEVASDVRVMLNDGCAEFSAPVEYLLPADSVPSSNEGADFDRDGVIDLAVANIIGDTVSVLLGDGSGGYDPIDTLAAGNQPRGVTVLDADADGDTDIAAANRTSSDVSLFLNQGDGTFAAPTSFDAGGAGETSIAAADADGDGRTDLFVGHIVSDDVACVLGDGNGGFTSSTTAGIGGGPWQIAIGDVCGDGVIDVASCNFDTNSAGVLRGDGSGGFLPLATYAAGAFPLASDLGDLDADGDLDMVISNYASGTWSLFENDGTGAFAIADTLAATEAGSCATLVDYDRDGDVDIVGIDEITDEVFLFPQTNAAPLSVQLSTCSASLRLDNFAGWAGFAGPAHPIPIGGHFFVGVTALPLSSYAILYGELSVPSILLDAGILSLFPPFILPGGITDDAGEAVQRVVVPAALPPGGSLVIQAVAVDPSVVGGLRLTNPESVTFVP